MKSFNLIGLLIFGIVGAVNAAEPKTLTFCQKKFGKTAEFQWQANPSGVADTITGKAIPLGAPQDPSERKFQCAYAKGKGKKCKVGTKELGANCVSKLYPITVLCPEEIKAYGDGSADYKGICKAARN